LPQGSQKRTPKKPKKEVKKGGFLLLCNGIMADLPYIWLKLAAGAAHSERFNEIDEIDEVLYGTDWDRSMIDPSINCHK